VALLAVLARAAPLPASTAAAINGAAKARVSFFIGTLPLEVMDGRGLRPAMAIAGMGSS
jgi:hypothetical protein